jgi:hypothetical protein
VERASFPAYGLGVQASFALPVHGAEEPWEAPRMRLRLAQPPEVAGVWSEPNGTPAWQTMFPGDCHVRCERGQEGDHLLTFGRRARFHLDRGCTELLCAPVALDQLDWQRFLLDTALSCASSIYGFEALHASAVHTPTGAVAFVAARGAGKSALAAELVARGNALVCDDVLTLGGKGAEPLAHPGPPFMTLREEDRAGRHIGEALGPAGPEGSVWVRVEKAQTVPVRLAAIYLLERRQVSGSRQVRESACPGRLLPHTLSLDRDPSRALSRLGLLRRLSASVPLFSLGGGDGDVGALADAVERNLESGRGERDETVRVDHASAA